MAEYYQGSTYTLYTNYIDGNGSPINFGISGSTVDIYYYQNNTKIYAVTSGTMTQDLTNPSTFYYEYTLPLNSVLTNNIVQYNAMYSGITIQKTSEFEVLAAVPPQPTGIGSVLVSGNVVDIGGTGINNASVSVSLLTGSTYPIAGTVTVSGIYQLYLDPNNYYLIYSATGYTTNFTSNTVPVLGSGTGLTFNFGTTTLTQPMVGPITITDTYIAGSPFGNSFGSWPNQNWPIDEESPPIPLSGLRVSLFNNSVTSDSALAVAYTNASGTFQMSVYPGLYVLLIEGNQFNNRVYKTAYDIDVDTAFTNNFRYLGTSQYKFLI